MEDDSLHKQVEYMATQLAKEDPYHGLWCMHGDWAVVWMGTGSLTARVVVEMP